MIARTLTLQPGQVALLIDHDRVQIFAPSSPSDEEIMKNPGYKVAFALQLAITDTSPIAEGVRQGLTQLLDLGFATFKFQQDLPLSPDP